MPSCSFTSSPNRATALAPPPRLTSRGRDGVDSAMLIGELKPDIATSASVRADGRFRFRSLSNGIAAEGRGVTLALPPGAESWPKPGLRSRPRPRLLPQVAAPSVPVAAAPVEPAAVDPVHAAAAAAAAAAVYAGAAAAVSSLALITVVLLALLDAVVTERVAATEDDEGTEEEVGEEALSPSFLAAAGLTPARAAAAAAPAAAAVAVVAVGTTLVAAAFMGNSATGAREVPGWGPRGPRDSSDFCLFRDKREG